MLQHHLLSVIAFTNVDITGLPKVQASSSTLQTLLTVLFGILGALALIFLTVGGMRYITSAGDPQKITQAKNTLIYALVGLVIAIVAEGLVTWVVGNV